MKRNTLFPMLGMATGLMAIIFAIVVFASAGSTVTGSTGTYTSYSFYGGDAYTGIQQAAADTARNVKTLAEIVLSGFRSVSRGNGAGYILLVMGFGLIAISGAKLSEYKSAAQYEQAVLNALKERKAPEQSTQVQEPAAAPVNRWRMDTTWPVADPGAVARRTEALVTGSAAEAAGKTEASVETEAPEEEESSARETGEETETSGTN